MFYGACLIVIILILVPILDEVRIIRKHMEKSVGNVVEEEED